MALLRNLEQSLSGLVEGTIGRVFRTEVRPTEIARKLAREMEINKRVSLSRTYAPTDYLVYLAPDDRARYAGVEQSIAEELGAYLLEHARRERLVLVRRPLVEFRTDSRLRMGEFGIEARTAPISAAEAPPRDEQQGERDRHASRRDPTPEPVRVDYRPELEPDPAFQPAMPLGAEPAAAEIDAIDEAPYEDPYAADPFGGGDLSQPDDYAWDEEPAAAAAPAHEPDWLDPVEDWLPAPAASPQPVAQSPTPAPAPPAPPVRPVPRSPAPAAGPAPLTPPAAPPLRQPAVPPAAGAPWIDPTLSRPQVRQAPVVPPPRRRELTLLIDGTPHELRGEHVVMGRSRTADIVISDPSVSRQHLELRRDARGWYALDLGSTNGSELNGKPIAEPVRLEPGMRLKLGHAAAIIEVR